MDLFYAQPEDCSDASVTLRNDEFHHLTRVMRRQAGDEVMVTDGVGNLHRTVLSQIRHDIAILTVSETSKEFNEPSLRVTLAIGMLKNPSRMEYAVEKCTEIGAAGFIPLHTARVIPHSAKIQRWKGIALAAMKQSCRSRLPAVDQIREFDDLIRHGDQYEIKFIAHESEDISSTIKVAMKSRHGAATILLLIGPEGGFTDEEVAQAKAAGFTAVSLGARRLRTETAAVVATAELLL